MKLYIIGIGPGGAREMTPRAAAALEQCDTVAGYRLYLELVAERVAGKRRIENGMTGEVERCRAAVEAAAGGATVAVLSSGDAGVYGMAGLVHELAEGYPALEIEVIPGVTAACSASAALGAPLTHDFAVVSLSDRLTDWAVIERRLRLAAEADFVLAIYNPASRGRSGHLARACDILLESLPPARPCGIARNVGRECETTVIVTLGALGAQPVDMFCTVIVGNSATKVINGRMVTPRGYRL